MSMIGNILRVTTAELEEYLHDSSLLEKRVSNSYTEAQDTNMIDLDKSWDSIIFLLTGDSFANEYHPLINVLFSGQLVDAEQDLGYGPAHYLMPEQVADLHSQISKITIAEL